MRLNQVIFNLFIYLSIFFLECLAGPITIPSFTSEGEIGTITTPLHQSNLQRKKYHLFTPIYTKNISYVQEDQCDSLFRLSWSRSLSSPIFSAPTIYPNQNNQKNIVVSTYFDFIEILTSSGEKLDGWPVALQNSKFQSRPLLYDLDIDGNMEVAVVDIDANLYWIRIDSQGKYLQDYHIQIPQLRVRKDWPTFLQNAGQDAIILISKFDDSNKFEQGKFSSSGSQKSAVLDPLIDTKKVSFEKLMENTHHEEDRFDSHRRLEETQETPQDNPEEQSNDIDSELASEEADQSAYSYGDHVVRSADDGLLHYYMSKHHFGDSNEDHNEEDEQFIKLPAHVLADPVLVDINRDGHMNLIFPVSYYFDDLNHATNIEEQAKYIASGILCWDVEDQDWLWSVHLDLTPSNSKTKAMVYSQPTIVDLDMDGRNEVIIGTSVGMLYVLDGDSGFVKHNFPVQFHSIHAQVTVGDLIGGNHLEMVVVDMAGTVAVLSSAGEILWDQQTTGSIPYPATLADIDGDGKLDVFVVTLTADKRSHIWALNGQTGDVISGFPFAISSEVAITGPILIAEFNLFENNQPVTTNDIIDDVSKALRGKNPTDSSDPNYIISRESKFLDLIFTSYNGHLYRLRIETVNSHTSFKCVEKLDLGGPTTSSPIIDDITGNGYLNLLIGNSYGDLFLFDSILPISSNIQNVWTSFPKGKTKNIFSWKQPLVLFPIEEKNKLQQFQHKNGQNLTLYFEIQDPSCSLQKCQGQEYKVKITSHLDRRNSLWEQTFTKPGRYFASFAISSPFHSTLFIQMTDSHGQISEDSVLASVSTKFYGWLKYIILLPVALFTYLVFSQL